MGKGRSGESSSRSRRGGRAPSANLPHQRDSAAGGSRFRPPTTAQPETRPESAPPSAPRRVHSDLGPSQSASGAAPPPASSGRVPIPELNRGERALPKLKPGKCPHCDVKLKWPNGLRKHVQVRWSDEAKLAYIHTLTFRHVPMRPFLTSELSHFPPRNVFYLYPIKKNLHDARTGRFHCERCSFKHSSKSRLREHEDKSHHTCPHCKGKFTRLLQHVPSCSQRLKGGASSSSSRL